MTTKKTPAKSTPKGSGPHGRATPSKPISKAVPKVTSPKRVRPSRAKAKPAEAVKLLPYQLLAMDDDAPKDQHATLILPSAPITADICERMAAFQLEIEYRPVTEQRNAVQEAMQQSYKDTVHNAIVTLVVEDMASYPIPEAGSGEGGGFPIVAADHPIGVDTKFFVKRAIERFVIATDNTVEIVRVVVQQTPLPGIRFII